jgi:DNA-binding protein YbaB
MSMPDFGQLSEQLSRLSGEVERARADMETTDVYGVSPDGTVRATMRAGRLAAVTIDPSAMQQDSVWLANQVLAAVQDCETRSADMLMRVVSPMASEVERTARDLG